MANNELYRFELVQALGLICSAQCNVVYASKGKYVISGALEAVYVWNGRTGELAQTWIDSDCTAEAVHISASPTDGNVFAVGYSDGSIRMWNLQESSPRLVFNGHKNQITALVFDHSGTKLASGARDNEIIIWDLVAETGLFRLRGHSNAITGLVFSTTGSTLLSTSKDTLLKVWDLATQHCVETVVAHHAEITALASLSDKPTGSTAPHMVVKVVTVGSDNKMRLFAFNEDNVTAKLAQEVPENVKIVDLLETINRSSNERALWVTVDSAGRHLAVLGVDKSLEIWRIRQEEEYAKLEGKKTPPSWFKSLRYTRLQSKAKSLEFASGWKVNATASLKLLICFVDNQLGEVIVPLDKTGELSFPFAIDAVGHRSDCRAVSLCSDGSLIATASKNDVKVWNPETGAMVRTIECDEPTVLGFISEDRGLIICDNHGSIHMANLISGELLSSVKAHTGPIRALAFRPDNKGMMTGGADKSIKFWEFKASKNEVGKKLKMIKTLQMNDEILGLKYSPDLRYVAVSTMDLTIKVFFQDSLRFYLSLYGHKLPVTDMDISTDGKILISASADKNIKIWSLEFGDCRKSIFGHQDAITSIAFISGTKQFITCSKDKTIKYWDAEKFQELQKLVGHQAEIWAMCVNTRGSMIVTVSKDRSIRVWRTSEEMLFPEEERRLELESQFERAMIEENPYERANEQDESGRATTKTITSMKAGERIMECIEAADNERRKWDEYNAARAQGQYAEEPTPDAFFLALGRDKTPAEFVLAVFERIPLPDVEEALLCLPTSALPSLLLYAEDWLRSRQNIVMSSRILDMVLRLFHGPIIANPPLRLTLESIRKAERETLSRLKDVIGYNNVAMQMA